MSDSKNSSPGGLSQLRLDEVISIRDPDIDVQEILKKIRANIENRKSQIPSLSTLMISEERLALRAAHESLRIRVKGYGEIGIATPGLKGKISFFIKRVVRKLIRRHIDQERDVQEGMLRFIERLIPYLDHAQYAAECLRRVEKIEETLKQKAIS